MYRVRFNLGRGENYMKWQVKDMTTKEVVHYDPDEVKLILDHCRLINNRTAAEKIFNGGRKTVCAWIECKSVVVSTDPFAGRSMYVGFNPRKCPHWVMTSLISTTFNEDIDFNVFERLVLSKKICWVM